jgi:hypothetical protein
VSPTRPGRLGNRSSDPGACLHRAKREPLPQPPPYVERWSVCAGGPICWHQPQPRTHRIRWQLRLYRPAGHDHLHAECCWLHPDGAGRQLLPVWAVGHAAAVEDDRSGRRCLQLHRAACGHHLLVAVAVAFRRAPGRGLWHVQRIHRIHNVSFSVSFITTPNSR